MGHQFEQWIKESKVTDHDGAPLIVYHGSGEKFDRFSADFVGSKHVDMEVGEIYYFSNDIKTAIWYAKDSAKQMDIKNGGYVYPVYLNLKNPLIVDFAGAGVEYLIDDIEKAKENGHDGLICRDYDDGGISDHYLVFDSKLIKSAIGNSGKYDPGDSDITDGLEGGNHFWSSTQAKKASQALLASLLVNSETKKSSLVKSMV